jgi:hypothetical protein
MKGKKQLSQLLRRGISNTPIQEGRGASSQDHTYSSMYNAPNFDRKEFQRKFDILKPPAHEAFDKQ